jgi:hypothetical protein
MALEFCFCFFASPNCASQVMVALTSFVDLQVLPRTKVLFWKGERDSMKWVQTSLESWLAIIVEHTFHVLGGSKTA